jgi:hypothetical protein
LQVEAEYISLIGSTFVWSSFNAAQALKPKVAVITQAVERNRLFVIIP